MADKASKAAALYYPPHSIGNDDGACCAKCMMYHPNSGDPDWGKCSVVGGLISGPIGVCGLYVHGVAPRFVSNMDWTKLEKRIVGYIDGSSSDGADGNAGQAPTHCGNCKYFHRGGVCDKVEGLVEFHGCCNFWEPKR